jgi:hypothetical protein
MIPFKQVAMKKTLTIALLATVSAMFVAGFVSTLATQQAYAATSASSLGISIPDLLDAATSGASAGKTSGSAGGLVNVCPGQTVSFLGSCSGAED